MTQLFEYTKLADETAKQLATELGADGIQLAHTGRNGGSDGVPLTPEVVAEMFPADGREAPYVVAGVRR